MSEATRREQPTGTAMSPAEQMLVPGLDEGHGPALDFRLDAILDKLDDDGDGRTGTLTGRVRQAPWKGRWCLVSEALLVVWSE